MDFHMFGRPEIGTTPNEHSDRAMGAIHANINFPPMRRDFLEIVNYSLSE